MIFHDRSVVMIVWNSFRNDARVLKEAQTLARRGFCVCVYALQDCPDFPRSERLEEGLSVRRFARVLPKVSVAATSKDTESSGRFRGFRSLISVCKLVSEAASRFMIQIMMLVSLLKSRPSCVHAHDFETLPLAWLATRFIKARLVYDAHEISVSREGYSGIRGIVGYVERLLMPHSDACITTTDLRAKFFSRFYSVPRPIVLENRPRFTLIGRNNRIRRELRLNESFPIVIYQGGLQAGRGLDLLVRAFVNVPFAYLVFVGGGRLDIHLRQLVNDLSLSDRVYFIPTVSLQDLPEYTASADIGVQPIENTCLNHYTTDSNKLFEYVAAGLPVVASDMPEIARVVRQNNLGLVVKAGSINELSHALRFLVDDSYARETYAFSSREAAKVLCWEDQEGKLSNCYKNVFSGIGD